MLTAAIALAAFVAGMYIGHIGTLAYQKLFEGI
jgi:hypothetical protein